MAKKVENNSGAKHEGTAGLCEADECCSRWLGDDLRGLCRLIDNAK